MPNKTLLRDVTESNLPIFIEQQLILMQLKWRSHHGTGSLSWHTTSI